MEFSSKNTGVGCHFLSQEIFPTWGLNLCLVHWQADSLLLSHQGSPRTQNKSPKKKKKKRKTGRYRKSHFFLKWKHFNSNWWITGGQKGLAWELKKKKKKSWVPSWNGRHTLLGFTYRSPKRFSGFHEKDLRGKKSYCTLSRRRGK